MLGAPVGRQDGLFYEFCLEGRVPRDHLLRKIDGVLDLTWLRQELAPSYSHTGRPSVCPDLMIRMLLIGYCYSIRTVRSILPATVGSCVATTGRWPFMDVGRYPKPGYGANDNWQSGGTEQ